VRLWVFLPLHLVPLPRSRQPLRLAHLVLFSTLPLLVVLVIGLARPLTAEPQLCRDILNGSVTESRENKVPNALQTGSSIAQLGAIAKKQLIPDLADEKVAQDVVDALMGKKEKPKEDHNTSSYEKGDEKESDS
jgi:hypothetical protein